MDRRAGEKERVKPRFVLVTPVIEDAAAFLPKLASACSSPDVAAVILRFAGEDADLIATAEDSELVERAKLLLPEAQKNGAMVLLDGLPHLVNEGGTDGTHLNDATAVQTTRASLKERIVGAGRLVSRHDAMIAGEGGADYVMFGEPDADGKRPGFDAIAERVSWWAELFQLPCIAYAASENEIPGLVRSGADFVAIGEEALWNLKNDPAATLAKLSVHLEAAEKVQ
jgi:thiamine-phosphate pyrophosphorylase